MAWQTIRLIQASGGNFLRISPVGTDWTHGGCPKWLGTPLDGHQMGITWDDILLDPGFQVPFLARKTLLNREYFASLPNFYLHQSNQEPPMNDGVIEPMQHWNFGTCCHLLHMAVLEASEYTATADKTRVLG